MSKFLIAAEHIAGVYRDGVRIAVRDGGDSEGLPLSVVVQFSLDLDTELRHVVGKFIHQQVLAGTSDFEGRA